MKVLHTVEFYSPSVGGAQEVVMRLSEALVARGHEVTVATTKLDDRTEQEINGVKIEGFDIAGNPARGFVGEIKRYQDFLLGGHFDIMMNYAAQQWATDLVFPIISELAYPKVLAPCGYSALALKAYRDYFTKLPGSLRRYDRIIYHSAFYQDKLFGDRHGITDYTIIQNGAAVEEFDSAPGIDFKKNYAIPAGRMVLSVANHYRSKGHGLVIEAFRRSQAKDAVLVIIGNPIAGGCRLSCQREAERAAQAGKPVVLLQDVPRDHVVAAFRQADLFLFGSAVECFPLVLIEAMASGTPFVSTDCGAARQLPGGIVVGDNSRARRGFWPRSSWRRPYQVDPTILAGKIDELLGDAAQRARLAEEGRSAWLSTYTWKQVVDKYEAVYSDLTAARDTGKTGGLI